jgi:hypothetical protein
MACVTLVVMTGGLTSRRRTVLLLLLGAVGYVVVRYGWDPQPIAHSCLPGTPVSGCTAAVGVLGHGAAGFVYGVLVGLTFLAGAALVHRYLRWREKPLSLGSQLLRALRSRW